MMQSQQEQSLQAMAAAVDTFNAIQTSAAVLTRYAGAYVIPFLISLGYFNRVELLRFWSRTPNENLLAYLKLGKINLEMAARAFNADLQAINQILAAEIPPLMSDLAGGKWDSANRLARRLLRQSNQVAQAYPAAIESIGEEFGFHFERQPASCRIAETERFVLYQVLPTDPKVEPRQGAKPILIIPPYVLGPNILCFLPLENRSYAHAFANQGIPTYIRIVKEIETNEAVQVMVPEDEVRDTKLFCQKIKSRHGMPLTLNGYCQGGFAALYNLLSGELDDLVDALITCVAPIDGTCSKGLVTFLEQVPLAFNDLAYGAKTLANGNQVVDGLLMGWIYKLKSIDTDTPFLSMWRDMQLLTNGNGEPVQISKTAAAMNYWLAYDRRDLTMSITRLSLQSYKTPIDQHGTLPFKLFGRSLNMKRIQEKKIRWLICYGLRDDLVEPASALAPTRYVKAETTAFPKGHAAIATSWSHPDSTFALHKLFPDGKRGPVRFQLDLQEAIERAAAAPVRKVAKKSGGGAKKSAAAPGHPAGRRDGPTQGDLGNVLPPQRGRSANPSRTKSSDR
jgi:hypothetical protein